MVAQLCELWCELKWVNYMVCKLYSKAGGGGEVGEKEREVGGARESQDS